jgi:hypothetical protein
MSSSEIVTVALAVIFLLFIFIGLFFTFGTKKARAKYREQNDKKREHQKARKADGQTVLKDLQNQASSMKKKYDDERNRRAEELLEGAKRLEQAKSSLKSEVETYLDNPSANSMRYRNDLQTIWESNGFSLTWERKEIGSLDRDGHYDPQGDITNPSGDFTRYVAIYDLTIEELQYPTEEVMNRQWTK